MLRNYDFMLLIDRVSGRFPENSFQVLHSKFIFGFHTKLLISVKISSTALGMSPVVGSVAADRISLDVLPPSIVYVLPVPVWPYLELNILNFENEPFEWCSICLKIKSILREIVTTILEFKILKSSRYFLESLREDGAVVAADGALNGGLDEIVEYLLLAGSGAIDLQADS